ncbi:MAG: glycosyltransferase [bacterium]
MCQLCSFIRDAEIISRTDHRRSLPRQVTIIAPLKDEEASIGRLIDGLLKQTYQPAEIILTDGGSSDQTREIIRDLQKTSSIPIVLIETDHAYPGRGRNLAIARAQNEWIASIDAGIVPDLNWLWELVKTAESEPVARIIYGQFEPVNDSYFTECAAVAYVLPPENRRFIASSLFHITAWQAAKGFREDLRTGEDLLFFESLDAAGVKGVYSQDAIVYWSLRSSINETFRYFVASSRHSLRAGLFFDWQFNVSRLYLLMLAICFAGVWRPGLLLLIPLVLVLRAERRIFRWYRAKAPGEVWLRLLDPFRVLTVGWINILIDVAMFCGMVHWVIRDCLGAGLERMSKSRKAGVSLDLEP